MKLASAKILAAALVAFVPTGPARAAEPDPDVARFITAKSNQVYLATRDAGAPVPPEVWKMFTAASVADWKSATDLLNVIRTNFHSSSSHRLSPEVWFRVQDV